MSPREDGLHLYITRLDSKSVERRMRRSIHVCPALPKGLHLGIEVADDQNRRLHGAGLNLTPAQARKLRKHLERLEAA